MLGRPRKDGDARAACAHGPARRRSALGLGVALGMAAVACGRVGYRRSDAGASISDAGMDAPDPDASSVDARPSDTGAPADAGMDAATTDTGDATTRPADAGTDAATTDTGDAAMPPADAAPDGGADAGGCGVCAPGRACDGTSCVVDPSSVVRIAGATFVMGTGAFTDNPPHMVTLSDYRIDRFEVTAGRYDACIRAAGCTNIRGTNPQCNLDQGRLSSAMNCIPHSFAAAYCAWAGGRLPTEAEWEYAARGSDGRIFPWGSAPFDCTRGVNWDCNEAFWGAAMAYPLPAGSVPAGASPFGLEDMSGNVWEWTSDWYAADYYTTCAGLGCTNPTGPATGTTRTNRGGGYFASDVRVPVIYPMLVMRADLRLGSNPAGGYVDIGFRCAYPP